ncbi:hypothetical protein AZE42_13317 [Rhizopogon vesiculosus]|uniref:Major facilitator superfamily (MFS) profile domain-containing protein n=1 Tax=Rhizopogon vesiculosus TaxID=180088 RepID=A0A1J8R0Q1_9AGAM|nr:hypothetical protein AZE42_13317 [Rhizopogon vesiculosus]
MSSTDKHMSSTSKPPASVTDIVDEDLHALDFGASKLTLHSDFELKLFSLVHHPEQQDSQNTLAQTHGINVSIVDWDCPDDPHNPKNWSFRRRWVATGIISAFTFISPVSSAMIAPAVDQIASTFGNNNDIINILTVSIFVLAYGK